MGRAGADSVSSDDEMARRSVSVGVGAASPTHSLNTRLCPVRANNPSALARPDFKPPSFAALFLIC